MPWRCSTPRFPLRACLTRCRQARRGMAAAAALPMHRARSISTCCSMATPSWTSRGSLYRIRGCICAPSYCSHSLKLQRESPFRESARRRQCWNNAAISRWKGSVDKFRYLVVEGPIGAGKTTLAKRLASRLSAELLLEQPSENPFLGRFYQDMARFALPAQLFFLFQRARMIEPLVQLDMFGKPTVADFLLDKDPLFARITLSGDELALYQKIYEALRPRAPVPDLVIYLQAQPGTLIERVRRRRAGYERGIRDRKSTRLNSSHGYISYAVFCLKKKIIPLRRYKLTLNLLSLSHD